MINYKAINCWCKGLICELSWKRVKYLLENHFFLIVIDYCYTILLLKILIYIKVQTPSILYSTCWFIYFETKSSCSANMPLIQETKNEYNVTWSTCSKSEFGLSSSFQNTVSWHRFWRFITIVNSVFLLFLRLIFFFTDSFSMIKILQVDF